ncbi:MAG: hypothetical protein AB2L20_11245 [Mangrovibacterium sp.]
MIIYKLFKIAVAELGQKEVQGCGNNPAIVNYAREAGFDCQNDDETHWCNIYINRVAMKAVQVRSMNETDHPQISEISRQLLRKQKKHV